MESIQRVWPVWLDGRYGRWRSWSKLVLQWRRHTHTHTETHTYTLTLKQWRVYKECDQFGLMEDMVGDALGWWDTHTEREVVNLLYSLFPILLSYQLIEFDYLSLTCIKKWWDTHTERSCKSLIFIISHSFVLSTY